MIPCIFGFMERKHPSENAIRQSILDALPKLENKLMFYINGKIRLADGAVHIHCPDLFF
jgi:hypothetical protein